MTSKFKSLCLFLSIFVIPVWLDESKVLAQERFVANGDGTVTDRESGLMWSQTDNKSDILRKEAGSWIKNQFSANTSRKYDNWRLPTVEELQSIYIDSANYQGYRTECGHDVKIIPQIRISCILIWSSNSALGLPIAFNFNLGNAFTVDIHDQTGCRVLAVRKIK